MHLQRVLPVHSTKSMSLKYEPASEPLHSPPPDVGPKSTMSALEEGGREWPLVFLIGRQKAATTSLSQMMFDTHLFCRAYTSRGLAEKEVEREREFFIDNLLVRIHFIIVTIRWTGLAPWEFEFPFPGSLTSTFLAGRVPAQPGQLGARARVVNPKP